VDPAAAAMAARTVIRRDLMILVYGKADSVEAIGRSSISRTTVKLRPGDHSSGVPWDSSRLRDHGAARGDLLGNEQTPHPSSDTAVPFLLVGTVAVGGNHHYV
jgi:hypothetical protein